MCSSRNCRKCVKGAKLCGFCSAHLCKLLQAQIVQDFLRAVFCSAHLCKLLRRVLCMQRAAFGLLLCALVQVASKAVVTIDLKQSSSALCTCASCFPLGFGVFFRILSFCSVHLCKLLLHSRSTVGAVRASALCTCASCFGKTAQFFASGSRSNLHRCAVTYHI